jgi:hypothetical protein
LNDKDAWRADLDAAIAISIRDTRKPLVNLTDDSEAGPSGVVKDEPVDKPDECSKQDVITTTCTTSTSTTTPLAAASTIRV